MDEQPPPAKADWTFQLNPPTVICFLYIAAYFTVLSAVIGVVLAYVWQREDEGGWEDSHYAYQIRTFWMAALGCGGGLVLIIAFALAGPGAPGDPERGLVVGILAGLVLFFAFTVLLVVRCALSLVAAQRNRPMPKPRTWLA